MREASLIDSVADLALALSAPTRLKILYLLAQAPRSVDSLSKITFESVANTSQHLQRLLKENLVSVKKEKLLHIYSLRDDSIALLIEELCNLAEITSPKFQTIEDYFDIQSVAKDIGKKKAILIDIRDKFESESSPVPIAMKIPLDLLKLKSNTLSKKKTYYLFCRGRACEMANQGVKILRAQGFKAFRIKDSHITINKEISGGNENSFSGQ